MEFIINQHHWVVLRVKSVNSCKVLRAVSGTWGEHSITISCSVYLAILNVFVSSIHYPKIKKWKGVTWSILQVFTWDDSLLIFTLQLFTNLLSWFSGPVSHFYLLWQHIYLQILASKTLVVNFNLILFILWSFLWNAHITNHKVMSKVF